jgi:Ca2+-binding EF-hand superfamily protein
MINKCIVVVIGVVLGLYVVFSCKSTQQTGRGEGRGSQNRPSAVDLLGEMDSNNDGQLSKNEVKGPLLDDFSKIDTNEDGFLSKEELENLPERDGAKGPRSRGGR